MNTHYSKSIWTLLLLLLFRDKGGEVKGQRGNGAAIAVIEDSHVIDTSGKPCFQTIRRVDCHILCENPASSSVLGNCSL